MTSSSGARSASAASTRVEEAMAGARSGGVAGRAGLERVGGAGLAQRLGERLERRERLLRAAAEQDGGAAGERGGGELVREPRLADAGLAGEQHEPAVAVHLHAGPRRAQALELGAAADEPVAWARVQHARRRDGCGRRAPQLVEQRARLARRRDAERAAQPLGEALAGGQRGGAVAGAREPLDQPAVRLLGERVERDLLARQADRRAPGRRARPRAARARRRAAARAPGGRRGPSRRRSRRGSARGWPPARRRGRRRRAPPRTRACRPRALERDRLAPGDEVAGRRAERAPQLGQRGAQACAGRLVEDVGPEARGELGAGVRARMQREVGEHGAGAPGGRRREHVAVGTEREPSGESDLQHAANCRAPARPVQGAQPTFTLRER